MSLQMPGFEGFIPQPIHHLSASTSGLAAGGGARQGGKPHPAGGPAHPHYVSRRAAGLRSRCRRKRKWTQCCFRRGGRRRVAEGKRRRVRAGNGRAGGGCSRLAAVAGVGSFRLRVALCSASLPSLSPPPIVFAVDDNVVPGRWGEPRARPANWAGGGGLGCFQRGVKSLSSTQEAFF